MSAVMYRRRSLREKLEIVRESLRPGVSAPALCRSRGISLDMLQRWRDGYDEMAALLQGRRGLGHDHRPC